MTKKLEDILNLPNVKEAFKEVDKKEKDKKIKESNGHNSTSKNLDPKTQANPCHSGQCALYLEAVPPHRPR